MAKLKTKDFDIRFAITKQLLMDGIPRSDIRHEIPLDTNSHDGRADMAVIFPAGIFAIEIKSGSDKMDRAEEQMRMQGYAFDGCGIIADILHDDKIPGHRHATYCDGTKKFYHSYKFDIKYQAHISSWPLINITSWKSYRTSPAAMINLLWRTEVQKIRGSRGNRCDISRWMSENMSLKEMRPLVIECLRGRVLNKWEESFWKKYDEKI